MHICLSNSTACPTGRRRAAGLLLTCSALGLNLGACDTIASRTAADDGAPAMGDTSLADRSVALSPAEGGADLMSLLPDAAIADSSGADAGQADGRTPHPPDAGAEPDVGVPDTGNSGRPLVSAYVGNSVANVEAHEKWLGKKLDAVLGYTGHASWEDYDGSIPWAMELWSAIDRTILWSVPLFPEGANLKAAAQGDYNEHYRRAAEALAKFRPQEPVLHVRTAWEFNGDWFPWHCTEPGCLPDFLSAWKQFVDTFRAVSSRFRFNWCPNVGQEHASYELIDEAYPGDDYVDVIGLDLYAGYYPASAKTPEQRWDYELTRSTGVNWLVQFGAKHKKPISFPEWGIGGNGGGDDPLFVQNLHDVCEAHHCAYLSYWDSNDAYPGELRNGQYPKAGAKYKELFGN